MGENQKDSILSAEQTEVLISASLRAFFRVLVKLRPAKQKGRLTATFLLGRGRRTRTHDTQFWRLVFYRLNYTPMRLCYYSMDFLKMQEFFEDFFFFSPKRPFTESLHIFFVLFVAFSKELCYNTNRKHLEEYFYEDRSHCTR